jgi:hypothetical protein
MTGHARLTVCCFAFVLGGLALASSAQAGWSRPFTVAHADAEGPVLATSPTHGAALAWRSEDDHVLRVRRLGPDGRLGRVTRVPGPVYGESLTARIAVGESGAIVVLWTRWAYETGPTLFAQRLGKHGKLGAIRTIEHDPDASEELDERLAMDAAGNATIAWNRVHVVPSASDYRVTSASVCIRRLNAAGSLGPTTCVPNGGGFDRRPRLAVEPSGRGVLSWIRQLNGRYTVHALLIRRDGTLGPVHDASAPQELWSGGAADVAVDGSGRATLAWSQSGPGDGVTIRQLSNHGLGPLRAFTSSAGSGQPRVAATASGAATVAWVEDPSYRVKAVHIRPSGAVGHIRSLSGPSSVSSAFALAVAADGLGNSTVVYNAELPRRRPRSVVQARRFSGRGDLGRPRNLSRESPAGVVRAVAVVADARGVVTALVGNRVLRFVP